MAKLRSDIKINHNTLGDVAGREVDVEGLWKDITGGSWMMAQGNPACLVYAMRAGTASHDIPIDDDVYYVKVMGLGMLIHSSEFEKI